jgi:signal transduction histidine kinase
MLSLMLLIQAVLVIAIPLAALALILWLLMRAKPKQLPAAFAAMAPVQQDSIEQAIANERERIYADLHDDVGAKLLELVYRAESPENAALARGALKDLRDVVSKTRGQPASLLESLAEMQEEARTRLESAGISLDWQQDQSIPEQQLDSLQHLHLFRIVREAISNVIRHAQAQHLKIKLALIAQTLRIEVKDNGRGQQIAEEGRGKSNMRQRAEQLQGHITWRGATEGGTSVLLSVPLKNAKAIAPA